VLGGEVHVVSAADAAVGVAGKREVQPAEATLSGWRADPALVSVERIGADAEDSALPIAELRDATAESGQFDRSK
jgi:hypothetical protein